MMSLKGLTAEQIGSLDVEQMLVDALDEAIEEEMVLAGHGTRAERDQKIIAEIIRLHNKISFDEAKTAL